MFSKSKAEAYFIAEKQAARTLLVLSFCLAAIGALLWVFVQHPVYTGMAAPLVLLGVALAAAAFTVFKRTDGQRKDIVYKMDMNPDAIRDAEIPRMEKLMQRFTLLRWVEMVALLLGVALVLFARQYEARQWLLGLGMGLAVMAAILVVFDAYAHKRSAAYLSGLQSWMAAHH